MRILLISSNSSSAGGGEQYLAYLARGLKELGEDPLVLLSTKSYMDVWETRLRENEVEVVREDLTGLRDRPLRIFQSLGDKRQIQLIASICERIRPDIIHINQQYDADGLDYLMGAMVYGKAKVFGTMHMPMSLTKHPRDPLSPRTWFAEFFFLDGLKRQILRDWYMRHPYAKIFISEVMRKEFETVLGRCSDTHVILNGIPTEKFCCCVTPNRKEKIIGFCGRFVPQKAPFLLVDGWLAAIRNGLKDSKLLLIGDGILRKKMEKKLRQKAPSGSWEITGWVENPEEYISRVDLMVFTSRFEGFPLAFIEALCMGKKGLATNFPGVLEFAEKIPWLEVVRSNDPEKLSRAMTACLQKNPPVESEVREIRKYFSCVRMAKETLALYKG